VVHALKTRYTTTDEQGAVVDSGKKKFTDEASRRSFLQIEFNAVALCGAQTVPILWIHRAYPGTVFDDSLFDDFLCATASFNYNTIDRHAHLSTSMPSDSPSS
jgi:hypothetical protein